jgi:threonine dehydrogenase-like Zn-dependent dehydrogenase
MRAAIMRDHKLVVDDVPTPEPGPGEVLVKTLACGICGSDLHTLKHAEKLVEVSEKSGGVFNMDLQRDIVMGHEFCVEVVGHGPDTKQTLKAGTRACSMPVLIRPSGVETVGYSNSNPGGYGELMRLTEGLLLEVPNGLTTEYAALTEPMAVGYHAVQMARMDKDDVPLVIGCGPVGLAVIAALRMKDIRPVVAADFSARRRKLAEAMGADIIIDPKEKSPYDSWKEAAVADPKTAPQQAPWAVGPPLRPAVMFECVGVPGVIDQIMMSAPQGTRIVVVGVCMESDTIQPMFGINKELNLQFVLGYSREEFSDTLYNIADGKVPVDPLITGKVGVEGVAQAFEDLGSPEEHAKILVEPWRS